MTIASKISRISELTDNIKRKLRGWSRLTTPGPGLPDIQGLEDCWTAINNISGTQFITNTNVVHVIANGKVDAQVSDPNLIPSKIVSGETILGVTGTGGGTPVHLNTDLLTINYGTADSIDKTTMANDVNLDYFTGVKLEIYPDSNSSKTLRPENIKDGVTILGVQGTYSFPTDTRNPTVTVVDSRTMTIPVDFNNIQELVCLYVELRQNSSTANNVVVSISQQKYVNGSWVSSLRYVDNAGIYCVGLFAYSISNGILTITLDSNSVFTFNTNATYYCYYTYIV